MESAISSEPNQTKPKRGLPAHLVGINERRRAAGLTVGRPKGVPNKISEHVRKAVLATYDTIGGDEAFASWAAKHRTEFYNLMVKLAPKEREANALGTGIVINVSSASDMRPVIEVESANHDPE